MGDHKILGGSNLHPVKLVRDQGVEVLLVYLWGENFFFGLHANDRNAAAIADTVTDILP